MVSTAENFRGRKLGQNRLKPRKYQVQISGITFEVLRGSLLSNKLPRLQVPRVQTFGKSAKGGGNPYFGQTSPTTTHRNSLRSPQQDRAWILPASLFLEPELSFRCISRI
jgi:hypothetical protein